MSVQLAKGLCLALQTTGKTLVTLKNGPFSLSAELFPNPGLKIAHNNSTIALKKDSVRFHIEW